MIRNNHFLARGSFRIVLVAVTAGLALSGCGKKSTTGAVATASSVPPPTEPAWVGRDQIKEVIALLNQGDSVRARQHLMAVLTRQPGDSVARQLISQIDSDPKVLLGTQNYSYTLKEGETLSLLAQRHLGSPMMFYALARYNDIAVPSSVGPGATILIPGKAPVVVARKPAPKPSATNTASAKPSAAKPAPVAAKPAPRAGNPAQAARLRGQGLAAMNAGAISRAVGLLRQALSFDPGSALIKADLSRALRIQNTVKGR